VGDPVAAEFVASLAQRGGIMTGVALNSVDVAAKRIQLLDEERNSPQRSLSTWMLNVWLVASPIPPSAPDPILRLRDYRFPRQVVRGAERRELDKASGSRGTKDTCGDSQVVVRRHRPWINATKGPWGKDRLGQWAFRGQADATWGLQPSAWRISDSDTIFRHLSNDN
jgi:hypothetical protein